MRVLEHLKQPRLQKCTLPELIKILSQELHIN